MRIGKFTTDHLISVTFDQNIVVNDSLKFEDVIMFKTISGLDDSATIGSYIGGKRMLQE